MRAKSSGRKSAHSQRIVWSGATLLASILLFTGCSSNLSSEGSEFGWSGGDSQAIEEISPQEAITEDTVSPHAENAIVRTGSLTIESDQPRAAAEDVEELALAVGGHVENKTVQLDEAHQTTAFLVLRIPDDRLDETFTKLADFGLVTGETREELDVTLQKTDLTARVTSLRGSIDRLDELLTKTSTVAELIELETARSDRQAELDSLQAQLDALVDQISFSTVYVNIYDVGTAPAPVPQNFWQSLLAGFASLATALSAMVIGFGFLLPWALVLTILLLIVLFVTKSRRNRTKHKTETPPPEV